MVHHEPVTMRPLRQILGSPKLYRPVTLAALLLSCVFPAIIYSSWHLKESWVVRLSGSSQSHPSTIPKKLWYKLGPKGLSDETRAWTDSCIGNNTDYEVEFMTESSADSYVRNKFGATHPDLVEMYLGLTGTYLVALVCHPWLHDLLTAVGMNQSPFLKPTFFDIFSSSPKGASTATWMFPAKCQLTNGYRRSTKETPASW